MSDAPTPPSGFARYLTYLSALVTGKSARWCCCIRHDRHCFFSGCWCLLSCNVWGDNFWNFEAVKIVGGSLRNCWGVGLCFLGQFLWLIWGPVASQVRVPFIICRTLLLGSILGTLWIHGGSTGLMRGIQGVFEDLFWICYHAYFLFFWINFGLKSHG